MQSLLTYQADHLKDRSKPDVSNWAEIYKVIGANVSPINRFGEHHFPYAFGIHQSSQLKFACQPKTYHECCLERAEEIVKYARKNEYSIGVLYSGGIDSTVILAALMQVVDSADLKNLVTVFMNQKSIQENPNFYYSSIRNSFAIKSSETFGEVMNNHNFLMVDGEHNDQLFGTDLLSSMINIFGFDFLYQKCDRENVTKFFTQKGMSQYAANCWFSAILDSTCYCPVPIKTIYDFFWWYNFSFKWQSVFFRIALRSDDSLQGKQISNIEKLKHQHFFSSDNFQNWSIFSMLTPDKKILTDWASYKHAAKKFIYDFNKDEEYFKNKLKFPSLANLFFNKKVPVGLTSDLIPIFSINKEDFYLPNNYFK